jgi:serine/threonine protein kinase
MAIINFKLNGRYVIERELGRGGFGIVYLARDTQLASRHVVIKTMRDGAFGDAWLRKKMDGEIAALLTIDHPGVVGISDMGFMPDGRPFFVMKYIEGESLRCAMQDQGMELKRVAYIILQLSQGLSAAHAAGIIHRDLKPENVMLQKFSSSGQEVAYLIDFGIATVKALQDGQPEQSTRVAGTLPYMAPEQLSGNAVPATDVWALGVMAYEMVTGQLPFPADNQLALHHMQQAGVSTEPRALRPQLPEAAQEAILKALCYDPTRRQAHAHEFGEQFQHAIFKSERPTMPISEKSMVDYPTQLDRQPTLPPRYELFRRCRILFEELDEFHEPDSLRRFFRLIGMDAYESCVKRSAKVDLDELLDCLSRSGRDYRGQALVDLLALMASHYRKEDSDYLAQECEGLRGSLWQLFTQPRK